MTNKEVKILTSPIRISIAVLIIGILFKIMHWPYGNIIITVAFSSISILYIFRFLNKTNKKWLDYAKLLLVVSFSIRGIFVILHLPFKDVLNIVALIAVIGWLALGGYKDYYGSKTKSLWQNMVGIGAVVIFVGALFKIMHWPGASIMLVFGLCLVALYYLISVIK